MLCFFFFQAEDGIRDGTVTGVQTCALPISPTQRPAATAAEEPPDEPPGTSLPSEPLRRHGDTTGPKYEVSFDEPMANSSLLSLPSITAPAPHRLAVTVDS